MDIRITTIIEALHTLQSQYRYTVLYEYSGIIKTMDVVIYKGGWLPDKTPVVDRLFNFNQPGLHNMYDGSTTTLEEFIATINDLKSPHTIRNAPCTE